MFNFKSKDEFINTTPSELSPTLQPDGQNSEIKSKVLIDECINIGTKKFEWLHKKSTGESFWTEILLTKITVNNENMIHVVCRDIKEKKALEDEINRKYDELEESNEELHTTIENLKNTQEKLIESEKMANLGELVSGVAHEINTPIGISLTGITHLLDITNGIKELYESDDMSQDEFEEYLKTTNELSFSINSNLNRTAQLIKSFKQVAVDRESEIQT